MKAEGRAEQGSAVVCVDTFIGRYFVPPNKGNDPEINVQNPNDTTSPSPDSFLDKFPLPSSTVIFFLKGQTIFLTKSCRM